MYIACFSCFQFGSVRFTKIANVFFEAGAMMRFIMDWNSNETIVIGLLMFKICFVSSYTALYRSKYLQSNNAMILKKINVFLVGGTHARIKKRICETNEQKLF